MKNVNIDKLLQEIFNDDPQIDLKDLFDQKIEDYGVTKTRALNLLSIDKDVFEDIIEGKAKQPNLIHIVKIAEFLDIDLDEFIQVVLKNQSPENIASIDRARKVKFLMHNFVVKALT
jgi:hypothetical protein